ncbi:putative hydrolase YxeP [Roseovarius aestuarii]|uniref:Putative hydrolase YxeP n=2 Tax=Roseovarius aestuarii TaxID=475083 RepID=A0A1X7BXF8_9RHOB|nr:putative hydrolase YxeP [Roseovarius aestuarii]
MVFSQSRRFLTPNVRHAYLCYAKLAPGPDMDDFHHKLTQMRHAFHRDPELGFQEVRTKAKVAAALRDLGLEVHEGAGVVGVLRAGGGNRAIGLRADMDALPITEASSHGYVSENPGVMHACGHDGHTTMLLGAAETLTRNPDFDGTVVFLFQPNEEHGLGARAMIDEGVLEQFPIDEVYAIHNLPGAPVGQVSTRVGQICASESLFEIEIAGQGGHASMPHVGVDAITVGAEMVLALQTIVSRKMAPSCGTVVSVTEFLTDGQRNVLPGHAVLKGDARSREPEDRQAVEKFMRQIVNGIAAAHGVSAKVSFNTEFIEVINSAAPTDAAARVARTEGLETLPNRPPMSFSEDFAHFCAAVPGCFLLLGNGETGPHSQPLHAADYDFNDALLPIGAAFWAALVRDRLPARQDT